MGEKEYERHESKVCQYLEEVCKIPRQSGDEEGIRNFLTEFAHKHGYETERDRQGNLLIHRPSTIRGYKGPQVILQGHMDMVYEKEAESIHSYEQGISVRQQDGFLLSADKTTLGADNGVAIACAMELLEHKELKLPDLEILFTTEEEVGLVGVKNLEMPNLKGDYLINLDGEEEGVFVTSCAGGVRTEISLPFSWERYDGECLIELTLKGLKGGHSGLDIGKERANAVKLLGRILYRTAGLGHIGQMNCPGKANAIASQGKISYYCSAEESGLLIERLKNLESDLACEFSGRDEIRFEMKKSEGAFLNTPVLEKKTVDSVCCLASFLPCGVIHWMDYKTEMVETSSNIGALTMTEHTIVFLMSSRSFVKSRKEELKDRMRMLSETFQAQCRFFGEYPQWTHKKNSRIREICREVYVEETGREPIFTGVHAGLECGYLSEKLGAEIDMVSLGADLSNVHTPEECVNIASLQRTEKLLIEILQRIGREDAG